MNLNLSWGYVLSKIGQELDKKFSKQLEPYLINARDFGIMLHVNNHPNISQKEIGDALKIDRTTMVQLIDNLEQKAYLQRTNNPKDRRSYGIVLTTEGKKVLDEMWAIMLQSEKTVMDNLLEDYKLVLDDIINYIKR